MGPVAPNNMATLEVMMNKGALVANNIAVYPNVVPSIDSSKVNVILLHLSIHTPLTHDPTHPAIAVVDRYIPKLWVSLPFVSLDNVNIITELSSHKECAN